MRSRFRRHYNAFLPLREGAATRHNKLFGFHVRENTRKIRAEEAVMRALRVYADTSVSGGVFDAKFAVPSRAFFEQVRQCH
jgi:hypothetical protein